MKRAELWEGAPPFPAPKPRLPAKVAGVRFERAVAKRTQGSHGLWWRFIDDNGEGFCQTDVVLSFDGGVVILECKLTEVREARRQLGGLYVPVVSLALGKPAKGIVVARHLTRESDLSNVRASIGAALEDASESFFPTVHWIGKGPI